MQKKFLVFPAFHLWTVYTLKQGLFRKKIKVLKIPKKNFGVWLLYYGTAANGALTMYPCAPRYGLVDFIFHSFFSASLIFARSSMALLSSGETSYNSFGFQFLDPMFFKQKTTTQMSENRFQGEIFNREPGGSKINIFAHGPRAWYAGMRQYKFKIVMLRV